jgi:hypothetical protein
MKKVLVALSISLFLISCGGKESKKEIVPENGVEEVRNSGVNKEEIERKKRLEEAAALELKKEMEEPVMAFTIQIGALKNKNAKFDSLENVQVTLEDGLYKYRMGSFETYGQAKSHLKTLLCDCDYMYSGAYILKVRKN